MVDNEIYTKAMGPTPSSFVQRMLTGVFSYDECMGATLTGSRKGVEKKKSLDQNKISEILGKFLFIIIFFSLVIDFFFFRGGQFSLPRCGGSWKKFTDKQDVQQTFQIE